MASKVSISIHGGGKITPYISVSGNDPSDVAVAFKKVQVYLAPPVAVKVSRIGKTPVSKVVKE